MGIASKIQGKAYVLGHDVDTDQIIPARYLVYSLSDPEERKQYGAHALAGVPEDQAGLPQGHVPFVKPGAWQSGFPILIAGKNFGCGSSREHAPAALQIAGVQAVVAESFARIFYRNAVDGGFFIPFETPTPLLSHIQTGDLVTLDVEAALLIHEPTETRFALRPLGDVGEIIRAGGLFAYARAAGLLPNRREDSPS